MRRKAARCRPPQMPWRMTSAVKADATQSAASEAGDELSATCNRGKCRETRLTARRLPCSCKGLAPEANLKIAERGEDKADARQGTRLKSLPAFSAHSQALHTALNSTAYSTHATVWYFPLIRKHCIPEIINSTCGNIQNLRLYLDTMFLEILESLPYANLRRVVRRGSSDQGCRKASCAACAQSSQHPHRYRWPRDLQGSFRLCQPQP